MGCSSCGKGGGARSSQSALPAGNQAQQLRALAAEGDHVLIEYAGASGARTYKGQATNTLYRFGSDSGHRRHLVWRADADSILRFKEFRLVTAEQVNVAGAAAAEPTILDVRPPRVRKGALARV
jgi:hypothetical protein